MPQAAKVKSEEDKFFMQRCLQLAYHAVDTAAPNPMVGAVVVHQGKIIGEGWHCKAGEAHAEPKAIRSVKNQELLKESTLYVSLEPCSHYGKTPPCADLIIEKQIPRVVIGCEDPFPRVRGRGIRKLQEAGIEVLVGVEKEACLQLNRSFITYHQKKRPYITLKWAQSADGKIDRKRTENDANATQISTAYTSLLVHKLRHESDAIMVGRNTAQMDNPSLSVRHWPSQNKPLRILLDREAKIGAECNLLDGKQNCLIFNQEKAMQLGNNEWIDCYKLPDVLSELYRRGVQRLLVEGGRQLHQSFIDSDLWDEIRIETSPEFIGEGVNAAQLPDFLKLPNIANNPGFVLEKESLPTCQHEILHIIRKIQLDF